MKRLLIVFFVVSFLILNISVNPLQFGHLGFKYKLSNIAMATGNDEMNMSSDKMDSSTDKMDISKDNVDKSKSDMNMSQGDVDQSKKDMDMSKDNMEVDKGHDDAKAGHNEGGHETTNNDGPNLLFLGILGGIILISIVAAAAIKSRRGRVDHGTSN